MTFGHRFKALRLEKELTQQAIAEDFNKKYKYSFNKSSISQYENELRKPELGPLNDWANYFGVSVDYLLGNTDDRNITIIHKNIDGYDVIVEIARNGNVDQERLENYVRFLIDEQKMAKNKK